MAMNGGMNGNAVGVGYGNTLSPGGGEKELQSTIYNNTTSSNKDYNNKCCSSDRDPFPLECPESNGIGPELQVIKIETSPSSPHEYKDPLGLGRDRSSFSEEQSDIESQLQHLQQKSAPKPPRKWEYFPGNNRFFCDGRVMTAPSIRFCVLSFGLILVTFLLFLVFDGPFLAERLTIAIPIIGSILFLSVIVNMIKTSFSDPGILPRASQQEWEHVEKSYATNNQSRPPPRTKDILVNGQIVKSKFCFTCKMFRPPRASHCGVCDNCVDRFDHHCPFLGNCIGKRNYRSFYAFIVSLSFLAVFVLSCSIAHLALISKEKGNFLEALKDSPTSAVVVVISFFGMWTVLGLSGFHTYLIAVEQTTNEDIKGLFGRASVKNPFSRGNFCQNCCFVLCGPAQPSLIDSRGFASADFLSSLPKKVESNGSSQPSNKCQNLQTSIKTGPNCVDSGSSQQGISKVHQQQPLMNQSPMHQQNQQPVQLSSPSSPPAHHGGNSSPPQQPAIPSSDNINNGMIYGSSDGFNSRSLGEATSESMRNLYSSIEEDPRISPDPEPSLPSRKSFMDSMLNGNANVYNSNGYFVEVDDFDDPTILHPGPLPASMSLEYDNYDDPDDPIRTATHITPVVNARRSTKSSSAKKGVRSTSNSSLPSSSTKEKGSRCDNKSLDEIPYPMHSNSSHSNVNSKGSTRMKNNSPKVKQMINNHTMINSPLHLDTIM